MFPRRRFLQIGLGAASLMTAGVLTKPYWKSSSLAVSRAARALGANIELTVLHEDATLANHAIDAALAAIDQVESVMSLYRPESQLCELNRTGKLTDPHSWLVEVLDYATEVSQGSGGAFDVTVQPLWLCWSAAKRENRLPTEHELADNRRLVDWRAVRVTPREISFRRLGTQITLNGIAQGFAADQAAMALANAGITHALLNTGEVNVLGKKDSGKPWTVGVQHPRQEDAFVAVARLAGRALSTSGDYATTFSPDRRHHHIVDPRNGYSPGELASVTIVAPTATQADALSTALLVMGADRGLRYLANQREVDALLVFKDGRTLATPGFPEEVVS